jgi:hypothetical protein
MLIAQLSRLCSYSWRGQEINRICLQLYLFLLPLARLFLLAGTSLKIAYSGFLLTF